MLKRDRIISLHLEGWDNGAIAREVGSTYRSVTSTLSQWRKDQDGYKPGQKQRQVIALFKAGFGPAHIADKLGMTANAVSQTIHRWKKSGGNNESR